MGYPAMNSAHRGKVLWAADASTKEKAARQPWLADSQAQNKNEKAAATPRIFRTGAPADLAGSPPSAGERCRRAFPARRGGAPPRRILVHGRNAMPHRPRRPNATEPRRLPSGQVAGSGHVLGSGHRPAVGDSGGVRREARGGGVGDGVDSAAARGGAGYPRLRGDARRSHVGVAGSWGGTDFSSNTIRSYREAAQRIWQGPRGG